MKHRRKLADDRDAGPWPFDILPMLVMPAVNAMAGPPAAITLSSAFLAWAGKE